MKTHSKKKIADSIAKELRFSQVKVKSVIDGFLQFISNIMAEKSRIELRNFGVFSAKLRAKRMARNPRKPKEIVEVPSRFMPYFKPGKTLKLAVMKGK